MPRFLINKIHQLNDIAVYLQSQNISIENISPPRIMQNGELLDVELNGPDDMNQEELIEIVMTIPGVIQILPAPDAHPS